MELGTRSTRRHSPEPCAHHLVGRRGRRGAAGRPAHRARCGPRQAGLCLEGHAHPQERGQRLLPAGRQDRRLHGHPPADRNDAGLATVLGHEVAHATAEHAAERIEREHLTEVAAAIIAGGVAFTPEQFVRVARAARRRGAAPRSRSAARRSPRRTTSGWSTWRGRATTRARPSPSGRACDAHRRGKSRPSSSATTRATRIG